MLVKTSEEIYSASSLEQLEWVRHGFGTRAVPAWPEPAELAWLKQTHSATVVEVWAPGLAGEGDALITNEAGLAIGVRTADCVPILLADERNRAVAAIHAGWKGTAAEIVRLTLAKMSQRYGTRGHNVRAAIGPSIGYCCYEVGSEVAERFRRWMPDLRVGDLKQKLDLVEVNRRQLRASGVEDSRIDSGAPCTFCRPAELHSFRRDGEKAGRMVSAIAIR